MHVDVLPLESWRVENMQIFLHNVSRLLRVTCPAKGGVCVHGRRDLERRTLVEGNSKREKKVDWEKNDRHLFLVVREAFVVVVVKPSSTCEYKA